MESDYNRKLIQSIELEILDEVIRICKKNHIKYNLEGGSCIGAVRHNGMIPWDDDIDLGMLRSEYNRFMEACKTDLNHEKFVFQDMHTEPNCGLIFGKVRMKNTILSETYSYHLSFHQGVWVDIFPYDNVPDNKKKRMEIRKKVKLFQNLYIIRCGYKCPDTCSKFIKFFYTIIKPITYLNSLDYYIKKIDELTAKWNDESSSYVFNYGGAYPDKGLFKRELFIHLIPYEFDGRQVSIFEDYDLYLSQLFGDYMELPPENKRAGGSHFVYEFKDLRKKD